MPEIYNFIIQMHTVSARHYHNVCNIHQYINVSYLPKSTVIEHFIKLVKVDMIIKKENYVFNVFLLQVIQFT